MPRAKNVRLSLQSAIDQTVELFENTENVRVRKEDGLDEDLSIYADPDQFSRVLSNLVKNAIQAIPSTREGEVVLGVTRQNQKAIVSVTDNGEGIPDHLNGKLFRPNFTTKSGGMGMGLAITRKIIEDLGGRISYETSPGRGTTFFVELPVYEEEEG
jgi:signal transduction histidine kinase